MAGVTIYLCIFILFSPVISYSCFGLYPSRLNILWSVPAKSLCFILVTRLTRVQDNSSCAAVEAKPISSTTSNSLELFDKYVQRIKLIFELVFRKADGTPYAPSDKEKKAMLLFRGGDDMKDLFEHVGAVTDTDTFDDAVMKIPQAFKVTQTI